ncbi:uncharacterized protein [Dendrobates tinctorius]|uniref:uncharacterized protein isoform X2 n=1 Tax=Dendrobates tinctorius TaxID=92724 RepID=UPI003CC93281
MSAGQKKSIFYCDVCQIFCSSAIHLSDHIGGVKHRNAVKQDNPELSANLQRLQYFLDTYLKDEPMIGLEYVVEYFKNGSYSYKCNVCDTESSKSTAALHLTGAKHRKAYLEKHHPELLTEQKYNKRAEFTEHMKAIALQVQCKYGRKRIAEVLDPIEASIKSSTRNFEIKNDGDASFIQRITKNFTDALIKYREEQTKTQASSTLPSNSDPESNKNPSDKTYLSSINLQKECLTPAQIPAIFQNQSETTDEFFKIIKNMDVSEVVVILKRITATNPEFQGINIPSLIKYLQDTRRLKNS